VTTRLLRCSVTFAIAAREKRGALADPTSFEEDFRVAQKAFFEGK